LKWCVGKQAINAISAFGDLAKGLKWQRALSSGVGQTILNVAKIEAVGETQLSDVRWRTADGGEGETKAATLLVHDGVIPNAQLTRAMRTTHRYNAAAAAWAPEIDPNGRLSGNEWCYIAGDNAGILGWSAATVTGANAGAAAAASLRASANVPGINQGRLRRAQAMRPLLDALYPPARAFSEIDDRALVCRCESIRASEVREALALGAQGPNQLKAFLRTGMGPCQGRMCAYTIAALAAEVQGRSRAEVELMRLRMPISPVTVAEISHLNETDMDLPSA
jgi:bacterioferritin-associated ferredoxin